MNRSEPESGTGAVDEPGPDTLRSRQDDVGMSGPLGRVLVALAEYVLAARAQDDEEEVVSAARDPEVARRRAAVSLRTSVGGLPELASRAPEPFSVVRVPSSPRAVRELAVLEREVVTFATTPTTDRAVLKCRGELLVAQLRTLADENGELEVQVRRSIRRLTAIAQERDIFLFGLARSHSANWRTEAARKRLELSALERDLSPRRP